MICQHLLPALLVLAVLFGCLTGCGSKPHDGSITTDALEAAVQTGESILVRAAEQPTSETPSYTYYECSGTTELSDLLHFDDWSVSETAPQGTPVLVLRFAEAWLLEIYSDGTALAHNGYAVSGAKSDCCYSLSSGIPDAVISYMKNHAILHVLGDGTISASTFHR